MPTKPDVAFQEFYENAKRMPVFVVLGVQGSGTNLLRSILVSAFNFSVIQDRSLIFNAAARLGPTPARDDVRRQFDLILPRLVPSALTRKTQRLVKSNASFVGIEEQFERSSMTSASDFATFVYAYAAYALGTNFMAIKSDDMWEHIDQIDLVLPQRRVVLLTRDFRDNLLSISKKDFGPVEPLVAAHYVKERFAFYRAEYQRTAPATRFHVRYEDLLEAPSEFVTRLSEHFGLTPIPGGMASVSALPIRKHNVKKWSGLDQQSLAQCEAILRDELLSFGYQTTCDPVKPPGLSTLTSARTRDVVKRVPQKVLRVLKRLRS